MPIRRSGENSVLRRDVIEAMFAAAERKIDMTFGSPRANGWRQFSVGPLTEQEIIPNFPCEKAGEEFYKILT